MRLAPLSVALEQKMTSITKCPRSHHRSQFVIFTESEGMGSLVLYLSKLTVLAKEMNFSSYPEPLRVIELVDLTT